MTRAEFSWSKRYANPSLVFHRGMISLPTERPSPTLALWLVTLSVLPPLHLLPTLPILRQIKRLMDLCHLQPYLLANAKVVITRSIGVRRRRMVCITVQWKPTAAAIFLLAFGNANISKF